MPKDRIHPDTTIPRLTLNVSNLEAAIAFYRDAIGLAVISRSGETADLGAEKTAFLTLVQRPGRPRNLREPGLYHFAILVPTRLALAQTLNHLVQTNTPLGGFADHMVSEAIYLSDPDENGIEVYRDRPRSEWKRLPNEEIQMATDPLDLRSLGDELAKDPGTWRGIDPGTRLGHIHLQVTDLRSTEDFYSKVLGFDVTARNYPGARFFSAGGYHHHIGTNTWNSAGALPAPPGSIGLVDFEICLPNAEELGNVVDRLREARIDTRETDGGLRTHDPSQNEILLTTGGQ